MQNVRFVDRAQPLTGQGPIFPCYGSVLRVTSFQGRVKATAPSHSKTGSESVSVRKQLHVWPRGNHLLGRVEEEDPPKGQESSLFQKLLCRPHPQGVYVLSHGLPCCPLAGSVLGMVHCCRPRPARQGRRGCNQPSTAARSPLRTLTSQMHRSPCFPRRLSAGVGASEFDLTLSLPKASFQATRPIEQVNPEGPIRSSSSGEATTAVSPRAGRRGPCQAEPPQEGHANSSLLPHVSTSEPSLSGVLDPRSCQEGENKKNHLETSLAHLTGTFSGCTCNE